MDLVGAEGRRGGTRGGRGEFKWEAVAPEERGFYLGNSSAQGVGNSSLPPSARRRAAAAGPGDWYARVPERAPVSSAGVSDGKPPAAAPLVSSPGIRPASEQGTVAKSSDPSGTTVGGGPSSARKVVGDVDAVRRRESAMLDAALGGRSFSDAVRAALTESVASGVDDEPDSGFGRGDVENGGERMSVVMSREQREAKAMRKLERARRREERLLRRAKRRDSSESERESIRSRRCEESDRRRRRRERESDREEENRRSTRRPLSDDDRDASDSDTAQPARRRARHR